MLVGVVLVYMVWLVRSTVRRMEGASGGGGEGGGGGGVWQMKSSSLKGHTQVGVFVCVCVCVRMCVCVCTLGWVSERESVSIC